MFYPDFVDRGVTFPAAVVSGRFFFWSRCPFSLISDSGIYCDISFSVIPGHVEKYPSLIAWSRVFVWLDSRGYDGKKWLSIAGILGDMIWGNMAPCISVAQ